jgi:aminoglycoside 3-N-acetyltransferase
MYSIEELANEFRKLGIRAADTVMLHASVRAVGEVGGGPDAIHLALKSVLTWHGTLMMYASCPRYYDEVGRGILTSEQEREIREKLWRNLILPTLAFMPTGQIVFSRR